MSGEEIRINETVVIKNADDKSAFVVKVNGEQKIGKSRVYLKDVIGLPYTTYFELVGRKFQKIENIVENCDGGKDGEGEVCEGGAAAEPSPPAVVPAVAGSSQTGGSGTGTKLSQQEIRSYVTNVLEKNAKVEGVRGDNSFYVDTNTAQKLSDSDILKLREQGLSGEEIIKTLIENSDTFAYKTDYAQAKWIKRKEMKYRKKYQILRATPATICEASFCKNKEKICNMRFDSLAQVLSQSGVYAGCSVLVLESTVGMVTGAVAYRMRGHGRILSVYGGQQPHLDMAKYFNLDKGSTDIVQPIPATELGPMAKLVAAEGFIDYEDLPLEQQVLEEEELEGEGTEGDSAEDKVMVGTEEGSSSTGESDEPEPASKKRKHSKGQHTSSVDQLSSTGRTPEAQRRLRSHLRQGVDRLIIAGRYRPLPLLKVALYLLAPSSPFVIYHEFMEPLVECYLYLQETQLALRLVLSDTWMREFQTLPGRVRPDMFMSTSGGYLLSGIYVGMVPRPFLADEGIEGRKEQTTTTTTTNSSSTV
eukprot:gene2810-3064_t